MILLPRNREGGNNISCVKMKKFVQSRGWCKNHAELTKHDGKIGMILYHTLKFYPTFETKIFSQLRTKHMFRI